MAKTLDDLELRRLIGDEGPATPATPYTASARYLTSLDGFNIKRPAIPPHMFREERDQALAPGPTAAIPLDLAGRLGIAGPATTPFILSRYLRLRAGQPLETAFRASTELHYVVRGRGWTRFGPDGRETLGWAAGDAFCLPGGGTVRHAAEPGDALLWSTTNEPFLAFEGCRSPAPGEAPVQAAHYPAGELRRRLLAVYRDPRGAQMAGKSVNLGNAALESQRTTTPTFTLALNSLLPGEAQRGHRHNAIAVTLVVAGDRCHSLIEGQRVAWEPGAVMITPPADFHSHHNEGDHLALFLIVQDGGLYYHGRTMGFSWT